MEERETILVVDDTSENVDILVGILSKEYRVKAAPDGRKALNVVSKSIPDLILLDIMMPEMDGFETCSHLKANEETKDIPIIFLTARVDTEDIVKGLDMGAVDYVTKPFKPEELLARVHTHLELRRAYRIIEQQNIELKEAAKLREDVEQIVRHDLKSPLNAIIGYPQMLLRRENLSDKGKRFVEALRDAGYRMLEMINNSLDLFKMERGVYKFHPVETDVIQILKKIEFEVEDWRASKELVLKNTIEGKEIGENDQFMIYTEELLCYSMLANLIKNAIEASPSNQTITINATKDDMDNLSVHNQGVVPEEIRETFFEKFSTARKQSGTGLGTYSARLIAETHQGQIDMETDDSAGTTITIKLPANPEAT